MMRVPRNLKAAPRRVRGLTLIELLVAVMIFAVLSAIAYRALTVTLESRGRIEQENRKWRDLALFFARLEQDVAAVAPRPIRDPGDLIVPAFVGNATVTRANEGALMLTRTAFAAEPGNVDPPRRLGYRLRDSVVELLTWTALDQGPRDEPRVVPVLHDVTEMQLSYLDPRGQRYATWPPTGVANPTTVIPSAVEISLTLASGERITRLLPTTARPSQQ